MFEGMFKRLFRKREINLASFIVGYNILSFVLYHAPLLIYTINHTSASSKTIIVVSVVLAQILASVMIFSLLSIIGVRFIKHLGAVFFIINSIAIYFIVSYSIMIDKTMMGNVFNTNTKEALDLFSPKIFLFIFALGILPAIFLYRFNIKGSKLRTKLIIFVVAFLTTICWGWANSSIWLWFDKHSKYIGSYSLPWSYVFNSVRHFTYLLPKPKQKLLSDLHFDNNESTLVVLVIGEAARRANFSLYGYARKTNPLLEKDDVVVLANAHSCATYTTASIECMLSYKGSGGLGNYEPLPSYLKRFGVKVLWRSANWGEPKIDVDIYQKGAQIKPLCKKNCKNLQYDEMLLFDLNNTIKSFGNKNIFVVLHQSGSHGPLYSEKYPKNFERFSPVCKSVELSKCSKEELINAYDNTIVYNDFFLHSLIQILEQQKRQTLMIYVSDHGESLGESGFYLHGTPKAIAPHFQSEVPFILWANEEFKKHKKFKPFLKTYNQDYVFHSVLGAFRAKSDEYKQDLDLFEPTQ